MFANSNAASVSRRQRFPVEPPLVSHRSGPFDLDIQQEIGSHQRNRLVFRVPGQHRRGLALEPDVPPPGAPPVFGGFRDGCVFLDGPHVHPVERVNHRSAEIAPTVPAVGFPADIGCFARFQGEIALDRAGRVIGQAITVIGTGELVGSEPGITDQDVFKPIHRDTGKGVMEMSRFVIDAAPLFDRSVGAELPPLNRAAGRVQHHLIGWRQKDVMSTPDRSVSHRHRLDPGIVGMDLHFAAFLG
jgi:hypothetical protein